jgi:hypothetical protein
LEDHLYRLRITKNQVLNLGERHVLFCPILKSSSIRTATIY